MRLAGLLVAAVLLVPAAGAVPGATPPLDALLARHVPILVLHPAERVPPVSVDGFLAQADLQRRTATGWERIGGLLPAGGAALRLDLPPCRSVLGPPMTSCYVTVQSAYPAAPVVYGAAFRRGSRIDLQYWLWYPWNVYSPTVPPGDLWQVHEGDWEAVSVILDAKSGKPVTVGLSSHCSGTRRSWSQTTKRGPRPLVYVAIGSHANFFRSGTHRLDSKCPNAPLLIEVITSFGQQPVDRTGHGRVVRPRLVRVSASTPSWMRFAGAWGEDAYVHFPGNDPILYGLGPVGPAFHEQWRKPVAEVMSWRKG